MNTGQISFSPVPYENRQVLEKELNRIRASFNDAQQPASEDEGRKNDSDKLRWDLLPPELMEETARVLGFGARKYSERNWEKGMSWGRPFAALMRHMWAWWRKENDGVDLETGYSHLSHAACCLAFLIAYEKRGIGKDDRHGC